MQEEQTTKQVLILNQAKKDIEKNKADAIAKVQNTLKDEIKDVKEKVNGKATKLLSDLKCESRDLDPKECYSETYKGFKKVDEAKSLCEKFYGENSTRSNKCSTRAGFCEGCCGHFIGVNFMDKRFACMKSCEGMIKDTEFTEPKK